MDQVAKNVVPSLKFTASGRAQATYCRGNRSKGVVGKCSLEPPLFFIMKITRTIVPGVPGEDFPCQSIDIWFGHFGHLAKYY